MLAMKTAKNKRGRSCSLERPASGKNFKVDHSIPLSNRFSVLGKQKDAVQVTKSQTKPSPITVTDTADVCAAINELNVQYRLKRISIGTKIFVDSEEDFKKLCNKFKELRLEFFTHPFGNKKIVKLVLCGLPEVQTSAITDYLKSNNNVNTIKVDMLKSESSNKKYIVQFDPSENSKSDIKNIKVLLNHVIYWIPYKRRSNGPTQCLNCGMYGHGISSCNRKSKCLLCGENHVTKDCHFDDKNNDHRVFKCNNCRLNNLPFNHRANDVGCPTRVKYMEIKATNNKKSSQKPIQQYRHVESTFPQLHAQSAPAVPQLEQTYANVAKRSPKVQQTRLQSPTQHGNATEDLFTFAEISDIMLNCVNELVQCKTKLDQIKVIANLFSNVCK